MTIAWQGRRTAPESSTWQLAGPAGVAMGEAQAGGLLALQETRTRRGQEPPRHVHQHEDELIYVLEGRLQLSVGDERIEAAPGACVLLPRGVEHGFVLTTEVATLLVVQIPAGLEGYLGELGLPAAYRPQTAPGARFGRELVGRR